MTLRGSSDLLDPRLNAATEAPAVSCGAGVGGNWGGNSVLKGRWFTYEFDHFCLPRFWVKQKSVDRAVFGDPINHMLEFSRRGGDER